jgi:hypothetical protein
MTFGMIIIVCFLKVFTSLENPKCRITVAVFEDLYGNLWALLQLEPNHPMA